MNHVSTLLLDFDGTLADSISVMASSYAYFLHANRLTPGVVSFSEINGPPLVKVIKKLKEAYGISTAEDELLEQYRNIISEQYDAVLPTFGALDLLSAAVESNIKTIIVTSNLKSIVKNWLVKNDLSTMVYDIVGCEEVKEGKPHPEPYLLGVRRANCPVSKAIAVEDSYIGAQSALNAKLKTYCIASDKVVKMRKNALYQSVTLIEHLGELVRLLPTGV